MKMKANYFISIGYLKAGAGRVDTSDPPELPLDPPLYTCTLYTVLCIFQLVCRQHIERSVQVVRGQ